MCYLCGVAGFRLATTSLFVTIAVSFAGLATGCGGDSPTTPSSTAKAPLQLEVQAGSSGVRTNRSLQDGFLPPPAVTYSSCHELFNNTDTAFSIKYEMEPLGPNDEVYAAVEFSPSPTTLDPKGAHLGCGVPTVNDFVLTHPVATKYRLRVRYSAPGGPTGAVEGTASMRVNFPPPAHVTISEFRSRGPNGASDQFIELYNDSLTPATFTGRISVTPFRSTSGGMINFTGLTIGAQCHFLLTGSGYSGSVPGDMALSVDIDDDGGISTTTTPQSDAVGMSAAAEFETNPLANFGPANTDRSYTRTGRDTNVNVNDFAMRSPSMPQNSTMCGTR